MDPHLFNYLLDSYIARILLAGAVIGVASVGVVWGCIWLYNNLSLSWAT